MATFSFESFDRRKNHLASTKVRDATRLFWKFLTTNRDLFGNPIGVKAVERGHNEDMGLTLNDDEWEALDEVNEECAKEASDARRAAAEAETRKANEQ